MARHPSLVGRGLPTHLMIPWHCREADGEQDRFVSKDESENEGVGIIGFMPRP